MRWVARIPAAMWLAVIGAVFVWVFYAGFTQRYPFAEFATVKHGTMATLSNLSADSLFVYIAGVALLFVLYAGGIALVRRLNHTSRAAFGAILAGGVLFCALLVPMYPFDGDDIWDYIIRGRMTTYYGLNPLNDVPAQIQADPFFEYTGWKNIPGAYGAGWEWIAAITARIAGDNLTANVVAFKLVAMAGYALTGVLVWLTLRHLAPRRALVGAFIWLWNPLAVLMVGCAAHNDAVMTTFVLLGMYCLARRWYIAATLAALGGALVKFVPLALIAICVVVALRELRPRLRVRYILLGGVLCATLFAGVNARFATGNMADLLSLDRRSRLYTGSVATIIRQTLIVALDGVPADSPGSRTPNTNTLISRTAFALLALAVGWQLTVVWRDRDPLVPVRALLVILLFYLLVSSFWFMSWYVLWVIPLAALLPGGALRYFVVLFSYLVTWEMPLYQYVTLRPRGWAPLPWRDLIPVAAYMGTAYGWIAQYWLRIWWRRANADPQMKQIGAQIAAFRATKRLSHAELVDEFGWRTDDLVGYERGEIVIPLDRLQQLAARLNFRLP